MKPKVYSTKPEKSGSQHNKHKNIDILSLAGALKEYTEKQPRESAWNKAAVARYRKIA